jgi:SAM-dependent methyltransferase
MNEWIWNRFPASLREKYPISAYGAFLHSLVKVRSARTQYHGTFFFRNRPQLHAIRTLVSQRPTNSPLKILVLACSNGAEVYSLLWAIRSARPDLQLMITAMDISPAVLDIAKEAVYSFGENKLVQSPIFERLSEDELQMVFDKENDNVRVKAWIREGIDWQVADANGQDFVRHFGGQDLVVANNFLCHMAPKDAESCLRNISRLVAESGYLVVSGVDLDVRTKVALELGWIPMADSLEEIHNGDPSIRRDWPWRYWGLEPFNRRRKGWGVRYASVFRCPETLRTQL